MREDDGMMKDECKGKKGVRCKQRIRWKDIGKKRNLELLPLYDSSNESARQFITGS